MNKRIQRQDMKNKAIIVVLMLAIVFINVGLVFSYREVVEKNEKLENQLIESKFEFILFKHKELVNTETGKHCLYYFLNAYYEGRLFNQLTLEKIDELDKQMEEISKELKNEKESIK